VAKTGSDASARGLQYACTQLVIAVENPKLITPWCSWSASQRRAVLKSDSMSGTVWVLPRSCGIRTDSRDLPELISSNMIPRDSSADCARDAGLGSGRGVAKPPILSVFYAP
jgi:hypothetical protein